MYTFGLPVSNYHKQNAGNRKRKKNRRHHIYATKFIKEPTI